MFANCIAQSWDCANILRDLKIGRAISRLARSFQILRMCSAISRLRKFLDYTEHISYTHWWCVCVQDICALLQYVCSKDSPHKCSYMYVDMCHICTCMWTCVIHAYVVADTFHLHATRATRCEQHASFLYDTPPESPLIADQNSSFRSCRWTGIYIQELNTWVYLQWRINFPLGKIVCLEASSSSLALKQPQLTVDTPGL